MTAAESDDLRAEFARRLAEADEQQQAYFYALIKAMRIDPDRAELRALLEVDPPEPAAMAAWLRAHEWLDVDPVFKLGRSARLVLAWEERQAEEAEHERTRSAALHVPPADTSPN